MRFLLQRANAGSPEIFAILEGLWSISWCDIKDIELGLSPSHSIPVGSVEYVTAYANRVGIHLPRAISYPYSLIPYMIAEPMQRFYCDVPDGFFVKPAYEVKKFTGGIKGQLTEYVSPDARVWCLPATKFGAEWRIYVCRGEIVGHARYDQHEDESLDFDISIVQQMVRDFEASGEAPAGYSIDVGLAPRGGTLLVEVNDGWALGYYPWGSCSRRKYAELLIARWAELSSGRPAERSVS